MAATKLINLLALLTIAVLACSFNATPANAITIHGGVLPHGPHSHGTAAKRRLQARQVKNRANTKRCKPRPSSGLGSPAPDSTSQAAAAAPTSQAAAPTSEAAVSITIVAPPPITTTIVDHSPVTQKAADPTPVYTPPSNGGGSGGKVGIAWNNPDTQSLRNLKQGQVSILYNWSPYVDDLYRELGFTTMSMLWGWKQLDEFVKNTAKPGYADWVMGPNEPDQKEQANMSPADAAKLYSQYISPLASKGYKLLGPACTSSPASIDWYKTFLQDCGGCHFDALALHWYGTKAADFIAYVQLFHNTFPQYKLMITEFACQNFSGGAQCSTSEIYEFMGTVTSWMNSQDYILYYFAFGMLHDMFNVNYANQLLGGNGKLTDLGWKYVQFRRRPGLRRPRRSRMTPILDLPRSEEWKPLLCSCLDPVPSQSMPVKLSPTVKHLLALRHPNPRPTPALSALHGVFAETLADARRQKVSVETGWLVLTTCALLTANSPASVGHLYRFATRHDPGHAASGDAAPAPDRPLKIADAVHTAAVMREAALKSAVFVGVPRTILSLAELDASLDEDVKGKLRTNSLRKATPETVESLLERGRGLWDSIYEPFAQKLHDKLGVYHPDFISFIINAYGGVLAPLPPGDSGEVPLGDLNRALTSVAGVACLRAEGGVGPQLTSHVFGLLKARNEPDLGAEGAWLASDEGTEWVLRTVDRVIDVVAPGSPEGGQQEKAKL